MPDEPEVAGLLALLLLTESRRASRTRPDGSLVLLGEQDRRRWDRALIEEGQAIVRQCLRRNQPGAYQLQAAINAVHSDATTLKQTDWSQIVALYDQLLALAPTPVVALNRAIAIGEVRGASAALALVDGPVAGQAEHQLERLLVGELLIADEGAPGIEAERDCDPGAQQCSAAASFPPRLGQHVGGVPPVRVIRREHGVVAGVGENAGDHLLRGAVVGVGLAQPGPQPLDRGGERLPALGVREGVALEVLAAAGAGERRLVGEVTVDGHPSYLGTLGDLADRGGGRPDRLEQLDRGLDDPLPGLVLARGSALELIGAAHPQDDTCCTTKLDRLHPRGVGCSLDRETRCFANTEGAAMSAAARTVSPIALRQDEGESLWFLRRPPSRPTSSDWRRRRPSMASRFSARPAFLPEQRSTRARRSRPTTGSAAASATPFWRTADT